MNTDIKRVEARIIVDYNVTDLGEGEINFLPTGLSRTILHQVGAGLLTGHTSALVETYEVITRVNPLWYIRAQDTNGDDMDLMVRAPNKDDAKRLWEAYYRGMLEEGDLLLEDFPDIDWIGQIPETTADGAIPWDSIHKNGE